MHPVGKDHSVGTTELHRRRTRPALHTCVNIEVIWTEQVISVASTGDCHVSTFVVLVSETPLRSCVHSTNSLNDRKSWDLRDTFIRKTPNERDRNLTTCCPYEVTKRPLVKHIFFVVTELIISSPKETCEIDFSGSSVLWTREYINLQLLASGILLHDTRREGGVFYTLLGSWDPSSISSVRDMFQIGNTFALPEDNGPCRRCL